MLLWPLSVYISPFNCTVSRALYYVIILFLFVNHFTQVHFQWPVKCTNTRYLMCRMYFIQPLIITVTSHEHHSVSNKKFHCLFSRLSRRTSKITSKLRVTGLCEGNPSVTGGFPSQRTNNAVNVSIPWCHHVTKHLRYGTVWFASKPILPAWCGGFTVLQPLRHNVYFFGRHLSWHSSNITLDNSSISHKQGQVLPSVTNKDLCPASWLEWRAIPVNKLHR